MKVFDGVDAIPLCLKTKDTDDLVRTMANKPILFSMSNSVTEIMPAESLAAGAAEVGTGRSDFDNQINNVLAFPGIFRGALDVRARLSSEDMKMAASLAIDSLVTQDRLSASYVIPEAFGQRVGPAVASAVAHAAVESGAARKYVKL